MMLTQLAVVARRTGYPVIEVPGWRTRTTTDEHGRPEQMTSVEGVTCHHTANGGAHGDAPSLHTVRDGRPDLEGPLAHFVLGVSGSIYVVAAGRCNHAGKSLRPTYESSRRIGIEAEAIGLPGAQSDWPAPQMDAYARLCAVLVDHFGLTVEDVLGHKETCKPPRRKSDPTFNMDRFRDRVAAVNLKHPPEEDEMKLTDEVDLTPQAAELLGKESATVRDLLQWPPGVRAARDEIKALGAELAAQRDLLQQVLQRLPPAP
jgi:HAMP domain-containing protein